MFCKGRSSVITPRSLNNMPKKGTACLHLSLTQLTHQEILGMLETRWWQEFDQTLSPRESLACKTNRKRPDSVLVSWENSDPTAVCTQEISTIDTWGDSTELWSHRKPTEYFVCTKILNTHPAFRPSPNPWRSCCLQQYIYFTVMTQRGGYRSMTVGIAVLSHKACVVR